MSLSWNEVRDNAHRFARDWAGESHERGEAKTFWDEFFRVFGIQRRTVASFEAPVINLRGQYGFIDLFWRGVLLVEHKSRGQNLDKAESQAFQYIQDLAREGRTHESPRFVVLSDFARVVLYDLEPDDQRDLPLFDQRRVRTVDFALADLHRHIREFAFLKGEKPVKLDPQDPANIKAAEIMGDLHDALKAGGYTGQPLERFLVRVLFCLFAEDTGIFEPLAFKSHIERRTQPDGSDLGLHLARLFEVLDTPPEKRQASLDEELGVLPYVNGKLFAERLPFADFNRAMRDALLACTEFSWDRISPAVFGSLFQSVMDPKERRQSGGHYTSERDILKVVRSLFLDDLRAELDGILKERAARREARLAEFHHKIQWLRVLDPACGCGNFLVVTYRELRRLELDVLRARHPQGQRELTLDEINRMTHVDVNQFYGIEIGEWPARIAEVALWLMDHQMNQELTAAFGQRYLRLPLRSAPRIVCANALQIDWKDVLPPEDCSYILGNPPFVGAKFQTPEQRSDMHMVASKASNAGLLDYVTGWYFKAASYIQNTNISVGFVSTNSISQGEQVGVLWAHLFQQYGIKIHFGHRTFPWASDARGKAHVHVVIVGFGTESPARKRIYDYDLDGEQVTETVVRNISPYLIEGSDTVILNRSSPICPSPSIGIGNKPIDGGNFLFTPQEKCEFLAREPAARPFFRLWVGSEEFLNGIERWCLWLGDCAPELLREMPAALERIKAVREFRLASKSAPTRKLAETPTRFHVENMPQREYLVVPEVSSERRRYIPIGFEKPTTLCSNLVKIIPGATMFHFGVLESNMHMAWVRQVCGRLESRYRYSNSLVYNNFPWPQAPTDKQKVGVEVAAQGVLDARKEFPEATLADLYDPLAMPSALAKAHAELDRAVDRCYRAAPFTSDRQRVEFLFALYEQLTAPLVAAARPRRKKRSAPPA